MGKGTLQKQSRKMELFAIELNLKILLFKATLVVDI